MSYRFGSSFSIQGTASHRTQVVVRWMRSTVGSALARLADRVSVATQRRQMMMGGDYRYDFRHRIWNKARNDVVVVAETSGNRHQTISTDAVRLCSPNWCWSVGQRVTTDCYTNNWAVGRRSCAECWDPSVAMDDGRCPAMRIRIWNRRLEIAVW